MDFSHIHGCSIVARTGNKILGWTALSPTSGRKVYSRVAEVSIYVSKKFIGRLALFRRLIDLSENNNIWTLQARIFPESKASIDLHKKCDFKIVGIREKIGKMNGIWRDVVLMEDTIKKLAYNAIEKY